MSQQGIHSMTNPGGVQRFRLDKIPVESIPISLHPALIHSMTTRRTNNLIGNRYSVKRIYGKLKFIGENKELSLKSPSGIDFLCKYNLIVRRKDLILAEVSESKEEIQKKEKYLFESKTLFFTDVTHRLSDLQKFLGDKGFSLSMINRSLNFENKVEIFQDRKGDFHISGMLCEEYINIRNLVYDHYNAV